MHVIYDNIYWKKGEAYLEQGVKGNRVPHNARYGGNGSFICTDSPEVYVYFHSDKRDIEMEILDDIKAITGRQRISQKLIDNVDRALSNVGTFELDQNGCIIGLEKALRNI